jgi:hypothetical protein
MTSTQPGELRVVARQLLTTTLGDDLLALYASGAEDGAGRLWLAIRPDTPPQRVREIFYPFWRRHRSLLTIGPLLGTPDDVRRYAKVLPQEVAAFRVDAELLDGDDLLVQALRVARADPLHSLAWVADETLVGSAIVASPDAPAVPAAFPRRRPGRDCSIAVPFRDVGAVARLPRNGE